jgi:hypothetical protein
VCRDSVVSAYKVAEGLGEVGSANGDVDASVAHCEVRNYSVSVTTHLEMKGKYGCDGLN